MGYFIELKSSTVLIPERTDVLDRLKHINKGWDCFKTGTSTGSDIKWFAWMPHDYDKTVTSVQEVFELLGFQTEYCEDDDGNEYVALVDYQQKQGQEDLFLAAVAEFVEHGSHVSFAGEDGRSIMYKVKNGKLVKNGVPISDDYGEPDFYNLLHINQ